ncbi:MAG TPA: hypothetical protein VED67_00125, partial [Thermodesulfovibrionales bacterium]|nr:hypothetical protein [Thermodesulfovibrionales bacterium]
MADMVKVREVPSWRKISRSKGSSTRVMSGLFPVQHGFSFGSGALRKNGAAEGSVQRRDTVSTVFLTP